MGQRSCSRGFTMVRWYPFKLPGPTIMRSASKRRVTNFDPCIGFGENFHHTSIARAFDIVQVIRPGDRPRYDGNPNVSISILLTEPGRPSWRRVRNQGEPTHLSPVACLARLSSRTGVQHTGSTFTCVFEPTESS